MTDQNGQGSINMHDRKRSSVVLLFVLTLMAGCGGDEAANGQAPNAGGPSDEADASRLVWTGAGPEGEPVESSASPVVADMVRQKFESIDWTRADAQPSLAIVMGPGRSLKITLAAASTDGTKPMVAHWTRLETEGPLEVAVTRRSEPLADADAALALLESYLESGDDWDDLEGWTTVSRGASPAPE
jgi:hypothetical protein